MRIAYLVAGAGRMHCGACAHDFLMVSHLRKLEHDVRVLPLYTPFWSDLGSLSDEAPVYMGGIGLYLRTMRPRLARLLHPLRKMLDSRFALSMATRRAIQTDARELGPLTLSVLQGLQGPHAEEFGRVMAILERQPRPEAVILTNSLFAPFAPMIRKQLQVPVITHFQGEDSFVMSLPDPYCEQAIALLRQSAEALSGVICPSDSGMQQASLLLQLPREKLHIVPAPVDMSHFAVRKEAPAEPFTVGYLSVVRPAKGLDVLIRAMQQLGDSTTAPLRLLIAGQVLDAAYAKEMRRLAQTLVPRVIVEFMGEVTQEEKARLIHRSHIFCMPTRIHEARAMAAMEAMACGVPVAVPRLGVLPELVAAGGGFVYEPEDAPSLAQVLRRVLGNRELLAAASAQAQTTIRQQHNPQEVAGQLDTVLTQLVALHSASAAA
jgi:glycosyltransferase involved in cell wall biosynthesis